MNSIIAILLLLYIISLPIVIVHDIRLHTRVGGKRSLKNIYGGGDIIRLFFAPILLIPNGKELIRDILRERKEKQRTLARVQDEAKRKAQLAAGSPKQLPKDELEKRWLKANNNIQYLNYKGQHIDLTELLRQYNDGLISIEELTKCPYCYHTSVAKIWGRKTESWWSEGRKYETTYETFSLCFYCADHKSGKRADDLYQRDDFWD